MGFLHFIYLPLVCLLLILVIVVGCRLVERSANALFKLLFSKERAEHWKDLTAFATRLMGMMLFVATLIYLVIHAPDKAELRVLLAKAFTYESTRIRIDLNSISNAQRQELVALLTPMMQAQSKEFRYYVRTRNGSYTIKATLPSYYRLSNDRLEIATGLSIAPHASTPLFQKIIEHATNVPKSPELPKAIEAQLAVEQGILATVTLLPQTMMLTAKQPKTLIPTAETQMQCSMTIQGLVSTDHFQLLFISGQMGVARGMRLRVPGIEGALAATEYEVHALAPVPGARGRIVKELPTDGTQIYAQLALTPVGFSNGAGCDSRLFTSLDKAWINTAIRNLSPLLASAIKNVSIERATRFSPWYADSRWSAVAPIKTSEDK